MNGEVKSSSATTGSSLSQDGAGDQKNKKTNAKENVNGTADDSHKQNAKPFDINDFFLSESLLPISGGVSSSDLTPSYM